MNDDRPTPRRRPQPAADEATDPVVGTAGAGGGTTLPPVRRQEPEPTVQLNVRIAADVSALINQATTETGRTKRQLIEHAIRSTYGS
jgi:hypothetical protein